MKLLLWLAGAWIILRAIRVLEERNAALDRQQKAQLQRAGREASHIDAGASVREKLIVARWRDVEHGQALVEDQKYRKPIRPIQFPKKGRAS